MKILISGGRVIDPATAATAFTDVAVAAGRIIAIKPGSVSPAAALVAPAPSMPAAHRGPRPGRSGVAPARARPEHAGMLASSWQRRWPAGSPAGSLPDTDPRAGRDPVLVDSKHRAGRLH